MVYVNRINQVFLKCAKFFCVLCVLYIQNEFFKYTYVAKLEIIGKDIFIKKKRKLHIEILVFTRQCIRHKRYQLFLATATNKYLV